MKKFFSNLTTATGASENRTAVSASENKTPIVFPASVQIDLFNYLKPDQQEILKPILRIIKHRYQEDLCISLLDYLEGFGNQPIGNQTLEFLKQSIIEVCKLRPLR